MTNREAIEVLIKIARQVDEDNLSVYTEEETEALELSIQALEKQEPKKPNIVLDYPFKDEEVCPNCKEGNIRYPDVGWMYKHCPDCGQALEQQEEEKA